MLAGDMSQLSSEVVICGAAIASVATSYHLAVCLDVHGIIIVDKYTNI